MNYIKDKIIIFNHHSTGVTLGVTLQKKSEVFQRTHTITKRFTSHKNTFSELL